MRGLRIFAPGKLFVVGEYAVLDGGRALVAALDAGIRCDAEEEGVWRLVAPDLGVELRAGTPGELVASANGSGAARLLAAAIQVGARELGCRSPLRLRVYATHPWLRTKSGLGGSSAAVVAVLGAVAAATGADLGSSTVRERLVTIGADVQRAHQGGRGSGADVAASVHGGWIASMRGASSVEPVRVPAELGITAAWSGVSSDTATALDAFAEFVRTPAGRGVVESLHTILERFWRALAEDDRDGVVAAVSAYGHALAELARGTHASGIAEIDALVSAARAAGAGAKSSGAVGGDCAIAVAFERERLVDTERRWHGLDARVLDAQVDLGGVRLEPADA